MGGILVGRFVAPRASLATGVPAAAAALVLLLLVPSLWGDAGRLTSARARLGSGGNPRTEKCFTDASRGALLPFLRWARREVPGGENVGLRGSRDPACWQLNLLPRKLVSSGPGVWTILIGPVPAGVPARDLRRFAPRRTLVRG